ncbi:STAS domain-containing protein [Heyndrickxia acidicola]|uniref:STAS domain-containing protein n=1 Tax=Heyndrickxia acidicola TaxID=209389 RepID=A0ABU6MNT3_9BACI|nr:STAS domain-containing protein [Heyndrickxia acidicola]MED1206043.1 STAS domain-containing protein [Heyndrickxia acidicola]
MTQTEQRNQHDQALYEYLNENMPNITEDWLQRRTMEAGSIYSLNANKSIERLLREQNTRTLLTVSEILIDNDAFEKSMKDWAIDVAKSRVEMDTPVYEVMAALSRVRESYWRYVEKFSAENEEIEKEDILKWSNVIHTAFDRLINSFVESYYKITRTRLYAQQALIDELSSPVIPIMDHIAVLPLIGDIDTKRAKMIQEIIPSKCAEANIQHLFIDLSGVTIVDTMVAQQIYHLTQILNLLGIHSTISGIRPEVAQTSIQLGLDFSRIDTFSSLKQALGKLGIRWEVFDQTAKI